MSCWRAWGPSRPFQTAEEAGTHIEAMSMFNLLNVSTREKMNLTIDHRQFLVDAAYMLLQMEGVIDSHGT